MENIDGFDLRLVSTANSGRCSVASASFAMAAQRGLWVLSEEERVKFLAGETETSGGFVAEVIENLEMNLSRQYREGRTC